MNDPGVKKRLLLIISEGDAEMNHVQAALKKDGYEIFVAAYNDMLYSLNRFYPFDAIVVNIKTEEAGLLEKCRQLRLQKKFIDTIVIFLSEDPGEEMMVKSFDAGVDFYINKPVNLNVLTSRINTTTRRVKNREQQNEMTNGITVDKERYLVICKGTNFHFPKKEFELLSLLISKIGKVFLRQEILRHVWNLDADADARTVDVHIHRIRQKLGGGYIKTVKGIGYKITV